MLPFSKLTKKLEFAAGNSDHLTMLNAYRVSVGQNRAYVTILTQSYWNLLLVILTI